MTTGPVEALAARVRTNGSSPLVIHYDLVSDTRVELSAITFANWVDKTVNLIEELGVESGDPVAVPLLSERPDHWTSLVWAFAVWQFGSAVVLDQISTDLVVCGPTAEPRLGRQVVSCSLHPLGLANRALDESVTDYAEVLAQPDTHWAVSGGGIAICAPSQLLFTELPPSDAEPGRILIAEPETPTEALGALCSVLKSGSVVLTVGADTVRLRQILDQERASFRGQLKSSSEKP